MVNDKVCLGMKCFKNMLCKKLSLEQKSLRKVGRKEWNLVCVEGDFQK
jgi:hypothetical protein